MDEWEFGVYTPLLSSSDVPVALRGLHFLCVLEDGREVFLAEAETEERLHLVGNAHFYFNFKTKVMKAQNSLAEKLGTERLTTVLQTLHTYLQKHS